MVVLKNVNRYSDVIIKLLGSLNFWLGCSVLIVLGILFCSFKKYLPKEVCGISELYKIRCVHSQSTHYDCLLKKARKCLENFYFTILSFH